MLDREPQRARMGVEILPFEMFNLPEFFKQKASIEINYDPIIIESSLQELKESLSNDEVLSRVQIKDEVLLLFLACRKFKVERTFQHLKKYVNFRERHPIMFKTPSADVLSVFMTSGLATILPWRCQDGCAIIFIRLGKCNAEQHPLVAIKQFYTFLMQQSLRTPMTQINGFKAIIDLDITMEVMKICTPQNMYLFLYGVLIISPGRFKGIHILNLGTVGRLLWNISSVFIPEKIKKRVLFHGSNDELLDYFPKSVIPYELGGELKDYDMTEWVRKYSSPEEASVFEF